MESERLESGSQRSHTAVYHPGGAESKPQLHWQALWIETEKEGHDIHHGDEGFCSTSSSSWGLGISSILRRRLTTWKVGKIRASTASTVLTTIRGEKRLREIKPYGEFADAIAIQGRASQG